jgi:hypothetical protein
MYPGRMDWGRMDWGRMYWGAVAYAACPVGRTRPRSSWDAPHLTIYALMALEDTWRG